MNAGLPTTAASSLLWAAPFAGLLASIALLPIVTPRLWHGYAGRIAAAWAALAAAPLVAAVGSGATARILFDALATQYLPFILMLFALFTTAGGVILRGELVATPALNAGLLALGTIAASVLGTTGASMILIRPIIRANAGRRRQAHVTIFFIFLVANIGGSLSPLGDPPLFMGFLYGVNFFWPLRRLWPATAFTVALLLAVFYLLDRFLAHREEWTARSSGLLGMRVTGYVNLVLAALAIAAVAISGTWRPGLHFDVFGVRFELQDALRDLVMIAVALASLALTDRAARAANGFEWEPLAEVAKLFAAIFVCIAPVTMMMAAGRNGPLRPVFDHLALLGPGRIEPLYFWLTGLLSSVLDSAPAYLVFFQAAGGDPSQLMGPLSTSLVAISLGAVYMGAFTYVGNAPNFMIYAIARRAGVPMPSFFGYLGWSFAVLLPAFLLVTVLFLG